MPDRPTAKYRPALERLEPKQLPSGMAAHASASRAAERAPRVELPKAEPAAEQPKFGFLVYRITNPNRFNNNPMPPFQQVAVQREQPIPGQQYNILSLLVRNGTARTFTAADSLQVRLPQQGYETPILTGDRQWKPGEWFVFYVLTKKYYPLPNQVSSGFIFTLGGAKSTAVPGPSAIFQRIIYDPQKFPRMLDWITARGPGVQGGRGYKFGLPVTNIYEFVSAETNRIDFGGYF